MKRCPECRRDYTDDTLLYCLEDGTALVQGAVPQPDEQATVILSEPIRSAARSRDEEATPAQVHAKERTSAFSSITPRIDKRLLLILAALAIVILGALFGYRYLSATKQIRSIAVMPFSNEGGNLDVEYLSDGMTETLIRSLSQLPNLDVKARSSVFRYKGTETEVEKIGKELNVQAILNGRVVQRGDELIVNLELINVENETVIWAGQYDRRVSDIVALQNEIARDVSSKLKVKLSGQDEEKLAKSYTADAEAYQLYLKGNYELNKRTPESLSRGLNSLTDP